MPFSCLGEDGEEDCGENCYDGYHNEKLDQGEAARAAAECRRDHDPYPLHKIKRSLRVRVPEAEVGRRGADRRVVEIVISHPLDVPVRVRHVGTPGVTGIRRRKVREGRRGKAFVINDWRETPCRYSQPYQAFE